MKTSHRPPSSTSLRSDDLLDQTLEHLDRGRVTEAMSLLFRGLGTRAHEFGPARWKRYTREVVARHPVLSRVHEAPMCRHSFERPRGYPGDAELIDYLYGLRGPDDASPLGQRIHGWCIGRRPVRGVRHRREWLASVIDAEAERTGGRARVLSVACGHLREGALSGAFASGWMDELVALDADAASLEVARSQNPDLVKPVQLSVARLPARASRLGTFDLIYSAGLYDYLEDELAQRLTAALFARLRPGGRLVIGNFLTDVGDCPFMEACMGWSLLYRTREEIEGFLGRVPERERQVPSFHVDPYEVFGYVDVRRKAADADGK